MDTPSTFDRLPERQRARRAAPLEIGWREWVALPDLGAARIKAKIDTGAKTSAIHALRIRELMRDGAPVVEFYLHPEQKRKLPEIFCRAAIVDKRRIKSSNGVVEERIVIKQTLQMGGRSWLIDLSLTNRNDMGFRLLLGRDALRKKAIINPGKSFLLNQSDAQG